MHVDKHPNKENRFPLLLDKSYVYTRVVGVDVLPPPLTTLALRLVTLNDSIYP